MQGCDRTHWRPFAGVRYDNVRFKAESAWEQTSPLAPAVRTKANGDPNGRRMSLTSATTESERMRPVPPALEPIPVVDSAVLVPLPSGEAILVGCPPEALKILILWEFPSPSVVVLPPDPLFAEGMNQANSGVLVLQPPLRPRRPEGPKAVRGRLRSGARSPKSGR